MTRKSRSENNDKEGGKDVEKYLVDMKELPNADVEKQTKVKVADVKRTEEKNKDPKQADKEEIKEMKNDSKEKKVEKVTEKEAKTQDIENKIEIKKEDIADTEPEKIEKDVTIPKRDIVIGVINFLVLLALVFLLVKLPGKANELKTLKNENLKNSANVSYEVVDEQSRKESDKLHSLFVDDSGLVQFVKDVESLRSEDSAVNKLSFASQKTVKDKTGNYGIPVIIELRGSWEKIGEGLEEIQNLPYLFRTVSIKAEKSSEDQTIDFKYGGFIYVNNKLEESR